MENVVLKTFCAWMFCKERGSEEEAEEWARLLDSAINSDPDLMDLVEASDSDVLL